MSEELIKCRVEDGRIVVPCSHLEEEVDGFALQGKPEACTSGHSQTARQEHKESCLD